MNRAKAFRKLKRLIRDYEVAQGILDVVEAAVERREEAVETFFLEHGLEDDEEIRQYLYDHTGMDP